MKEETDLEGQMMKRMILLKIDTLHQGETEVGQGKDTEKGQGNGKGTKGQGQKKG